jgi:hypothetical protein
MKCAHRPATLAVGGFLLALANAFVALEVKGAVPDFTEWSSASGSWTNRALWSDGLPNPFQRTEVHGKSSIVIPAGTFDKLNYIGNYLKAGPSTAQKPYFFFHSGDIEVMPDSLFVTNNILEGSRARHGVNEDNWLGMGGFYFERNVIGAVEPFPAPPVTTESPRAAYENVLKNAGATLPRRDALDDRVVREVREGTGHIINWVKDAGGWPDFTDH